MKLKTHAMESWRMAIEFLKFTLKDFPEDKLNESFGEAETVLALLRHVGGTAHFWMQRAEKPFSFPFECDGIPSFLDNMEKQFEELKASLEKSEELTWSREPLSVPWIMIRTANHMMHHAAMLIYIRHILGLDALEQTREVNWGKIVDLAGKINYEGTSDLSH